jgi:hypothetical protein
MIEVALVTYTDTQWNEIRTVVRDTLGLDADQIKRQVTPVIGECSIAGIEPLWSRIETAATAYRLHDAVNQPSRDVLDTLREDAEKLRVRIIKAIAVPVRTKGPLVHPLPLNGVDADMVPATSHYFRKLIRTIDGQIKLARSRRNSARKTGRNQFWNALLAIWCELGGKPNGVAAARFVIAASEPLGAGDSIETVVKWLDRQRKTPKSVTTR